MPREKARTDERWPPREKWCAKMTGRRCPEPELCEFWTLSILRAFMLQWKAVKGAVAMGNGYTYDARNEFA